MMDDSLNADSSGTWGNSILRDEFHQIEIPKDEIIKDTGCIKFRYVVVFMNFFATTLAYGLRVNLSVGIIAMVKYHGNEDGKDMIDSCPTYDNNTNVDTGDEEKPGAFSWNEYQQGIILSSFYWGYIITQLPGGIIAEKYGAKFIIGFSLLVTVVCTLCTPMAANFGYGYVVLIRVIAGLGEGVMFPALHSLLSKWAPKLERSKMLVISYSGTYIGPVVAMPLSGYLASSDFLGGWPSIFYVFGVIGFVWFALWTTIVSNNPSTSMWITKEERDYILHSIDEKGGTSKNPMIPWRSILTSLPVWSTILVHTGHNWFFFTLLTELPTYMKNILHFNTMNSGLWSSFPYLMMSLGSLLAAIIADWVIKKRYLTIGNTRKILTVLGHWIPAGFLIAAGYTGCNVQMTVAFLTFAVGTNGLSRAGYEVNHLDLSKHFVGILMGITNCMGSIPGIAAPYLVGYLTNDNQTFTAWRIVFYIAAFAAVIPSIFFLVFGSGERQEWDYLPSENHQVHSTNTLVASDGIPISTRRRKETYSF